MKLSWKNIILTLLAVAGATIVYAKFYNYSWAIIGSWRSAVAVLSGIGLLMIVFSDFDFENFSLLNLGEMIGGAIAFTVALVGVLMTSSALFYILAIVMGTLWLVDTARRTWRSLRGENTRVSHRHAAAH